MKTKKLSKKCVYCNRSFCRTQGLKIHILLDHLEDFFDDTERTLKDTSDELIEHMHSYQNKGVVRGMYVVEDMNNPSRDQNCIVELDI